MQADQLVVVQEDHPRAACVRVELERVWVKSGSQGAGSSEMMVVVTGSLRLVTVRGDDELSR